MRVVLALLLLLATPAFATFRIEPPAPNDRSLVVLQVRHIWRDGCVPFNPTVSRVGSTILVRWDIPDGGCTLALRPWNDDVPLGVFEAGEYTVVIRADDVSIGRKFVVTEAAPALRIEPRLVGSNVATEVRIRAAGGSLCITPFVPRFTLTVDGAAVPFRVEDCVLVATLPPHAPGPVAVRVEVDDRVYEDFAAVHYVDPNAMPDESLYERVLVPVLFNGPGAFGSQWVTETEIVNASDRPISWLPAVAQPLPVLAPGASTSLLSFGNRASGLLLFVPRGQDLRFGALFRDVSRDASQWGTELPIVREHDVRDEVVLLNVPFDGRYRVQLRIYGLSGETVPVAVMASSDGLTPRFTEVVVKGPCALGTAEVCNTNQPAYASVDLMSAFAPAISGRRRITVTQLSPYTNVPLWAFVTVTNNATQQVTTISPQ